MISFENMEVTIREVKNKKDFNRFIDFPYQLYKDNKFYVPPLKFDEASTLDKKKNPAFEYCDARLWLAMADGKVIGRIAAILNHAFIRKWGKRYMRFGWLDFIPDPEVPKKLLENVTEWAKENQCEAVHGPMGFTDFDHEGMLVEGFEETGTLATIYNFPYYHNYIEQLGYTKDIDWKEFKIKVPEQVPEKVERLSSLIETKYNLKVVKAKNSKDILNYATQLFDLINKSYAHLYGVVELTEKQITYYTKQYFSFIRADYLSLVTDSNNKLIAFAVTMPSLSAALQKCRGRLFPFGFLHLLMAMKKNKLADMYLVAVHPDWQNKGVNAILMREITRNYILNGVKFAETNPELENNNAVQSIWTYYESQQHKRRRCYIRQLSEPVNG